MDNLFLFDKPRIKQPDEVEISTTGLKQTGSESK